MKKYKSVSFVWTAIFVVGFGVFMYLTYQKPKMVEPAVLQVVEPSSTALPLVMTQISPDGSSTVSIKQSKSQVEIVVDGEMIMTKVVDPGVMVTIPFNGWSPNSKYFFIKEKSGDVDDYLVLNSTGKPFPTGEAYLSIRELFAQAYPDNAILAVSGWAAPTLVVLNARSDSEDNMSFWFDVQTHKFIRLSTNFY